MCERFAQSSSVIDALRTIVNNYSGDVSILLELLQNADDAGATVVRFMLDPRTYECNLPEPRPDEFFPCVGRMRPWCGPALYAYNNALFTAQDYANISNIASMGKMRDLTKTGRFGQGFNSVYHITDLPSWVSGDYLTFSDPHGAYVYPTLYGLKIPLSIAAKRQEQFRMYNVFENIFQPSKPGASPFVNGTLFRFPLRTETLAKQSLIKNVAATPDLIHALFIDLIDNPAISLLFLRNVERIELYNPDLVCVASVSPRDPLLLCRKQLQSALVSMSTKPLHNETKVFTCTTTINITRLDITTSEQWVVYQILGGKACPMASRDHTLKPLAGVALNLNGPVKGKIFCSLPLPITSNLPFHINGFFSMTSDRRSIEIETHVSGVQDDKVRWNKTLLLDMAAPLALQLLQDHKETLRERIYSFFPTNATIFPLFVEQFFMLCWDQESPKALFLSGLEWVTPQKACFLSGEFKPGQPQTSELLRKFISLGSSLRIIDKSEPIVEIIKASPALSHLISPKQNLLCPLLVRTLLRSSHSTVIRSSRMSSPLKHLILQDSLSNGLLLNYIFSDLASLPSKDVATELYNLPLLVTADGQLVLVGKSPLIVASSEEVEKLHDAEMMHPRQVEINPCGLFTNPTFISSIALYELKTPTVFSAVLSKKLPPKCNGIAPKYLTTASTTFPSSPPPTLSTPLGSSPLYGSSPVRESFLTPQPPSSDPNVFFFTWDKATVPPQFLEWTWKLISGMKLSLAERNTHFGALALVPTQNNLLVLLNSASKVMWQSRSLPSKVSQVLLKLHCLVFDESIGSETTAAIQPLLSFSPQVATKPHFFNFVEALRGVRDNILTLPPADLASLSQVLVDLFSPGTLDSHQSTFLCSIPIWRTITGALHVIKRGTTFLVSEPMYNHPAIASCLEEIQLNFIPCASAAEESLLKELGVEQLKFNSFVEAILPVLLLRSHGTSVPCSLDGSFPSVMQHLSGHQLNIDKARVLLQTVMDSGEPIPMDTCKVLSTVPCICTAASNYKCPTELFDPKDPFFCSLFPSHSQFFPLVSTENTLKQLRRMKLNTQSNPSAIGVKLCLMRVAELQNSGTLKPQALSQLSCEAIRCVLLPHISSEGKKQLLAIEEIPKLPFIPCKQGDMFGSLSHNPEHTLVSIQQICASHKTEMVCGTQQPVLNLQEFLREDEIDQLIEFITPPRSSVVLAHLCVLVSHFDDFVGDMNKVGARAVIASLNELGKQLKKEKPLLKEIQKFFSDSTLLYPVFIAMRNKFHLVHPSMLSLGEAVPPFVFELPKEDTDIISLLNQLGSPIPEIPTVKQIVNGLSMMKSSINNRSIPKDIVLVIWRCLQKFAGEPSLKFVVAEDDTLCDVSECYISDAPWILEKIDKSLIKFVDKDHSDTAKKLGCLELSKAAQEFLPEGTILNPLPENTDENQFCMTIQKRILSPEFFKALYRLFFYATKQRPTAETISNVCNLKIVIVQSLKTHVLIGGRDITARRQGEEAYSDDYLQRSPPCLYLSKSVPLWDLYLALIAENMKPLLNTEKLDTNILRTVLAADPSTMGLVLNKFKIPDVMPEETLLTKPTSPPPIQSEVRQLTQTDTPGEVPSPKEPLSNATPVQTTQTTDPVVQDSTLKNAKQRNTASQLAENMLDYVKSALGAKLKPGTVNSSIHTDETIIHCTDRSPEIDLEEVATIGPCKVFAEKYTDDKNARCSLTPSDYSSLRLFWNLLSALIVAVTGKNLVNEGAVHIFLENGGTIAFNFRNAVYFNLHYFQALNHPIELRQPDKGTSVLSFWYVTVCHELAHNVESGHNAAHNMVMLSIISASINKFIEMAQATLKVVSSIVPPSAPSIVPAHLKTTPAPSHPPTSGNPKVEHLVGMFPQLGRDQAEAALNVVGGNLDAAVKLILENL
ncbi:Sacsin protein [Pelomyxa schiedti]|nr:Sacsin protein [Pelomyxa schiedti]